MATSHDVHHRNHVIWRVMPRTSYWTSHGMPRIPYITSHALVTCHIWRVTPRISYITSHATCIVAYCIVAYYAESCHVWGVMPRISPVTCHMTSNETYIIHNESRHLQRIIYAEPCHVWGDMPRISYMKSHATYEYDTNWCWLQLVCVTMADRAAESSYTPSEKQSYLLL